jgi:hypothetical protein
MKRAGHTVVVRGRSGGTVSSHQLLNKFSAFYSTRRLITVFTGPCPNHVNAVQILETHFFRINFNIIPKEGTHDTESQRNGA